MKKKHLLLLNPWIYDFAAYDLWMKPVGFLRLARLLFLSGYEISYLDCLDRFEPGLGKYFSTPPKTKKFGCGKFYQEEIKKPTFYQKQKIPRKYKRYGWPPELLEQKLKKIRTEKILPSAILVTSMMTYWYLGVKETIEKAKKVFPGVPVILGGVYPTLCPTHAQNQSGADYIVRGPGEEKLLAFLHQLTGYFPETLPQEKDFFPFYELYSSLPSVAISTSEGCSFRCSYCAVPSLYPTFHRRKLSSVVKEIEFYTQKLKVKNIAFYDDALLLNAKEHLIPLLRELQKRKVRCFFHTPNGLHLRFISLPLAKLLYQSNFRTIRLSLETANEQRQKETGGKVSRVEFLEAVKNLKTAGYKAAELEVYLMVGLPNQTPEEVVESMLYVHQTGAMIKLVEYSPVPGTQDWTRILPSLSEEEREEPLFQNNSIYPLWRGEDKWEKIQQLRSISQVLNYLTTQRINLFSSSSLSGAFRKFLCF